MISVIAVSIYTLMDKIMIEWMTTTTEVGYYENTEKIVAIANNAAGAVGAVMLPRVSNLRASGNDDKVLSYIGKSMKYIMLIAVALAFGIAGVIVIGNPGKIIYKENATEGYIVHKITECIH